MEDDAAAAAPPEALEQGRYKVFPQDNGYFIARAVNTCERCQECGCGDQQETLDISPGGMVKMLAKARAAGVKLPFPILGRGRM